VELVTCGIDEITQRGIEEEPGRRPSWVTIQTSLLTLPTVQLLAHIRDLRARQPVLIEHYSTALVVREGHAHRFPTHPFPQVTSIKPRRTYGRIV